MRNRIASLSEANRFSFTCPIFNSETELRACVTLRNKLYAGQRLDIRKGCQACMSSGKCPAAVIVSEFAFGKGEDVYASSEPLKGKLGAAVLDRIAPVMVLDTTLTQYGCSSAEISLIQSSGDRIKDQLKTAPAKPGYKARILASEAPKQKVSRGSVKSKAPNQTKTDKIAAAAASGDMSAAINEQGAA